MSYVHHARATIDEADEICMERDSPIREVGVSLIYKVRKCHES
jgi:hypothetical protein